MAKAASPSAKSFFQWYKRSRFNVTSLGYWQAECFFPPRYTCIHTFEDLQVILHSRPFATLKPSMTAKEAWGPLLLPRFRLFLGKWDEVNPWPKKDEDHKSHRCDARKILTSQGTHLQTPLNPKYSTSTRHEDMTKSLDQLRLLLLQAFHARTPWAEQIIS